MYIKGIGTIRKDEAMSILTADGKSAVKDGDITLKELGEMYKLEMAREHQRSEVCNQLFRSAINGSRKS